MDGEPDTIAPRVDRAGDAGLGGGDHAVADREVSGDAHLAGQRHALAHLRAARDADLARQHAVGADRDRVPDLHQVVDLGAAPHAGLVQRGPVDRGQRADLDVVLDHHDADLRDLLVAALRVLREAEPVRPDHGAVLHDHAVAQAAALAHLHARVQQAVRAHLDARVEHDVGVQDRARAHAHAGAHHGQGAHVDALAQLGRGVDRGRRVYARRGPGLRVEQRHRARERQVGIVGEQAGERGLDPGRHDHARGARRLELRGVARAGNEREVPGRGLADPGHAPDLDVAVTAQRATQALRQLAQPHAGRGPVTLTLPAPRPSPPPASSRPRGPSPPEDPPAGPRARGRRC